MPRKDVANYEIFFECDFCGEGENVDGKASPERVDEVMSKWRCCAHAYDLQANRQTDPYRWYDSRKCQNDGEEQHDRKIAEAKQKQKELDEKLAKANEALKKSGFMDHAAQVAKA